MVLSRVVPGNLDIDTLLRVLVMNFVSSSCLVSVALDAHTFFTTASNCSSILVSSSTDRLLCSRDS